MWPSRKAKGFSIWRMIKYDWQIRIMQWIGFGLYTRTRMTVWLIQKGFFMRDIHHHKRHHILGDQHKDVFLLLQPRGSFWHIPAQEKIKKKTTFLISLGEVCMPHIITSHILNDTFDWDPLTHYLYIIAVLPKCANGNHRKTQNKTNTQMEDPPIGFRFYPTEEELVGFYLHNQLEGQRNDINRVIPVTDINGIEPWNLPRKFFFFKKKTLSFSAIKFCN